MNNNEKTFCWSAADCADQGEPAVEKLAIRLQTVEIAAEFKKAFEAAREFNAKGKAEDCKDEDLVWAPVVEDVVQTREDDIDVNKGADD